MAIITISRGTMSGGESLAKCLSERLSIPAVSQETLQEAFDHLGISRDLLLQQSEKTRGLISGSSSERTIYLAAIQLALAERAQKGPFVYYGHAGHLLIKGVPQVLKVRVIAPLDQRARRHAETQKISFDEAKKAIEKMDESRIKWLRFLYGVDWRDPSLYDLVVNLDLLGSESACAVIISALNQKEFVESTGYKYIIEDFLLASRVKAELAASDRTKGLELDVSCEQGEVTIFSRIETGGIFRSGRHQIRNELIEVAKQVPGVKKVLIGVEDIPVVLE
jgi:cytidylate kinase